MRARATFAMGIVAIVVVACSGGAASPTASVPHASSAPSIAPVASATPAALTIYGAASLKAVLAKVKTTYEAATRGSWSTVASPMAPL
jgi:ABC-type molybdate transport system substrate-binding protein